MTPPTQSTGQPTARVRLGWATVGPIERATVRIGPGVERSGAELDVPAIALSPLEVEYLGQAVVEAIDAAGNVKAMFTGIVDRVEIEGEIAHLTLVGSDTELAEQSMGGLVVGAGNKGVEMIYSILRTSGIPDDRMNLEGWDGGTPEVFIVAVPVDGVTVTAHHTVFDVALSPENPARLDLPTGELVERFTTATCWASTTVHENTVYDAEQRGLQLIDEALAAIRAMSAFSYSTLRGELRPFHRDRTRARVRRSDLVFTGSVTSRRRWLRSTADTADHPTVAVGTGADALTTASGDDRLRRAITEWRDAADSESAFERVTHLWRSIEVYAKGAAAPALFDADTLRDVQAAIGRLENLSKEQRSRLRDLTSRSNDAPLLARLRAALLRDNIDVADEEFVLLKRTRELRNDLEHGRVLTPLEDREVLRALGIMNRVLVTALSP